jgi:multiple sugar transport system ATP-binding protein
VSLWLKRIYKNSSFICDDPQINLYLFPSYFIYKTYKKHKAWRAYMAEVRLENVSKIYNERIKAVDAVNLTIHDKEFMVLVGPSGCGKSTTLRMVAGLEEISDGNIYIDDVHVNDIPPKDRDIAMVFQNYALYPHMTVFENMAFGLKLRKFRKEEIKIRVEEAADILDLQNLLDRRPKELSGGQRQRVAVGRAIVRKPKVFLFDEPLSNLDAKLRVQMRVEISKLHQRLEATMIYVTHDQVEAMTMGDRITVMKDGIVQQVESPTHLYSRPTNKFVAGFIGSPAMNFFNGELIQNVAAIFKNKSFEIELPKITAESVGTEMNKSIVLGVRPEDFSLQPFDTNKKNSIKALVEVIEPMGSENYLYLKTNDQSFIVRTAPSTDVKINDTVILYINLGNIHLFDEKSSESLMHSLG